MTKPMGFPAVFVLLGAIIIVVDIWWHLNFTGWGTLGALLGVIGFVLIIVRLAQK